MDLKIDLKILASQAPKPFHKTLIDADLCYRTAEQKAKDYYQSLYQQVSAKTYAETLTKDFQAWQKNHIRPFSFLFRWFRKNTQPNPQNVQDYIHWLDVTGKLENYLDRSVSYIFMRDLGKALDSPATQQRIRQIVDRLKDALTHSASLDKANKTEKLSLVAMYRKAQKENNNSTFVTILGLENAKKEMWEHYCQAMEALEDVSYITTFLKQMLNYILNRDR